MALSGKERQRKFRQDQEARGLVELRGVWVPEDEAERAKVWLDQLRKTHRVQTYIQQESLLYIDL